jgi:hypothetical protein
MIAKNEKKCDSENRQLPKTQNNVRGYVTSRELPSKICAVAPRHHKKNLKVIVIKKTN